MARRRRCLVAAAPTSWLVRSHGWPTTGQASGPSMRPRSGHEVKGSAEILQEISNVAAYWETVPNSAAPHWRWASGSNAEPGRTCRVTWFHLKPFRSHPWYLRCMSAEELVEHGHFVYLYRDLEGRPVYVGRGGEISRAEGHAVGTHNSGLAELIAKNAYTLEIAGRTDLSRCPRRSSRPSSRRSESRRLPSHKRRAWRRTQVCASRGPLALAERGASPPVRLRISDA